MACLLCLLVLTSSFAYGYDSPDSYSSCALAHLLTSYAGNDKLTLSNVAMLFDGITVDYKKNYHKHQTKDELKMNKRAIHSMSLSSNDQICSTDLENSLHRCQKGIDIMNMLGYNSSTTSEMNIQTFNSLCPALLYQVVMRPCIYHPVPGVTADPPTEPLSVSVHGKTKTWIGALGAVLIISVAGIGVISIIPFLKNQVYRTALQYLVALAVGTLVGDAILHLLPHALVEPHSHVHDGDEGHNHSTHSWKPLLTIAGIYLFFNVERFLAIISTKKQVKKGGPIEVPAPEDNHRESCELHEKTNDIPNCKDFCDAKNKETRETEMSPLNEAEPAKCDLQGIDEAGSMLLQYKSSDSDKQSSLEKKISHMNLHDDPESHGHGHSHDVPQTFSSVVYMVIVGDGLHNFTDGLAIGAAFAGSFAGGMSTSLAVLCHELPHELGDFAMLLKSGLTVKKAYLCNVMSACLQLFGVVIGVLAGNIDSVSQWLFAFAGGVFLYVGLVNMLPEIAKVNELAPYRQLLIQNLGLVTGFSFMLVIATFESDIESIFSSLKS